MGGEIEAESLLFLRHAVRRRPGLVWWDAHIGMRRFDIAEQAALPAFPRLRGAGSYAEDRFRGCMDSGPVGMHAVKGACRRQAFQLPPVEQARFDPVGEIVQRLERPASLPPGPKPLHNTQNG